MAYTAKKQTEVPTSYKIMVVVSFTQIGNGTSYRRNDHEEEITQLMLDGWYPHGNPFVDATDKQTVYQAFIR